MVIVLLALCVTDTDGFVVITLTSIYIRYKLAAQHILHLLAVIGYSDSVFFLTYLF